MKNNMHQAKFYYNEKLIQVSAKWYKGRLETRYEPAEDPFFEIYSIYIDSINYANAYDEELAILLNTDEQEIQDKFWNTCENELYKQAK